MAKALIDLVSRQFPAAVIESHSHHGDETIVVEAASWHAVAKFLRDDPRANMLYLVDLTAVDFLDRDPRFEVVAHLASLAKGHRLRIKTRVGDPEGESAKVDSLADLWGSANWAEREAFDMFGIDFTGHPDLRRILLYPEFVGHPLRKDFPADRIQPLVDYRDVPNIDKLAPFGPDEGMSFGRQTHATGRMGTEEQEEQLMEALDEALDDAELELPTEPMLLNVGPAHPAMHGTVRCVMELSGESILKVDVQVGYLHRGFEKMCERGTWTQVFPYVDRCNYVSPMLNNVGFAMACEKLLDISVPERCQWYRMALGELARMSDHLTCDGAMAMELGAFTPFLWMIKGREMIWDLMEEETGARLTHSFGRVGGMAHPPTDNFKENARAVATHILTIVEEVERLLLGNRIFLDRLENIGIISPEDAVSLGWTGPCLRACGIPFDVRKSHPYLKYDEVEFDVPVGTNSDCFDRFIVRLEEIKQSARILEQCLTRLADKGPVNVDDPRVILPPKDEVYSTIEGTIQHFKIVMEGLKLPAGEVYSYTEGGNGELGFYLVSDGSGTPWRVRIRPPCYYITGGLERVITGHMMADVVPCFGSLNMIGGECDR